MAPMARWALLLACPQPWMAWAQLAGRSKAEEHPSLPVTRCSKAGGCKREEAELTMDSQWRWTHDQHYSSCIENNKWAAAKPDTCGSSCAVEGIGKKEYRATYGITEVDGGVQMKFDASGSVGARVYLLEGGGQRGENASYKMFQLLNREFSFEVDMSTLACGINGALYFVEMQANGGYGTGGNKAGAEFGTGYCDAQCPHDLKFIEGKCNLNEWHMTRMGPKGRYGSCCSELDIWEANAHATAITVHPCETVGPSKCVGLAGAETNSCGDSPEECLCCHQMPGTCDCCGRYEGVCDKDGCEYNPYRLGNTSFLGKGSQFTVDTGRPVRVVTQFLTSDGTDDGYLTEIRRFYVQDGKVIHNSAATNLGSSKGNTITDELCSAQKEAFGYLDDFSKKGGLRAMGEAMRRGMVLALSIWDDGLTEMHWLDSQSPSGRPANQPGVKRGPCLVGAGHPAELVRDHRDAAVVFTDIRYGEIGSTWGSLKAPPVPPVEAREVKAPSGHRTATAHLRAPVPTLSATTKGDHRPAYMKLTGRLHPKAAPPTPMDDRGSQPVAREKTPVCCSSSQTADRCNSCWRTSALEEGYCASADGCPGCGGHWCPDGVIFADAYEAVAIVTGGPTGTWRWHPFLLAVPGIGLCFVVASWLRTRRRSPGQGELAFRVRYDEISLREEVEL